jgi:hypothetical protein
MKRAIVAWAVTIASAFLLLAISIAISTQTDGDPSTIQLVLIRVLLVPSILVGMFLVVAIPLLPTLIARRRDAHAARWIGFWSLIPLVGTVGMANQPLRGTAVTEVTASATAGVWALLVVWALAGKRVVDEPDEMSAGDHAISTSTATSGEPSMTKDEGESNKGWRIATGLGRRLASTSPEAKSAGAGAAVAGGLGMSVGPHIGIAALGTAVSGAVVLPVAGVVVGAVAGYATYVALRDRRRRRREADGRSPT